MALSSRSDLHLTDDHPLCDQYGITGSQLVSVMEATLRGPKPDDVSDELWQTVWALREDMNRRAGAESRTTHSEAPEPQQFELTEEQVDDWLATVASDRHSTENVPPLDGQNLVVVDDILVDADDVEAMSRRQG